MEAIHSRTACTFIPFRERNASLVSTPWNSRDFVDGSDRRMSIYRHAWSRCLLRMQEVLTGIQDPIVSNVVYAIRNAYKDALPGLPHPEIPLITISGDNIVQNVTRMLAAPHDENERRESRSGSPTELTCVAHVYPPDCTSMSSVMQAIAMGLAKFNTTSNQAWTQGKSGTRLVACDINTIIAWFNAKSHGDTSPPSMVILFHDFEQCNIGVIQDLFYIFSRHLGKLPVVLLAASSSISISTYLSTAYTRSTLSLVRAQHLRGALGIEIVEEVLTKTFFDTVFLPDVMIGPTMVQYIEERASRTESSIDGIFTALQVAHLKHFDNPLTLLIHDELLGAESTKEAISLLSVPSSFPFLDSVLMRTLTSLQASPSMTTDNSSPLTINDLLSSVKDARKQFQRKLLAIKCSYSCLRFLQKWFSDNGYKAATTAVIGGQAPSALKTMQNVLSGRADKDLKYLIMSISKLRLEKLLTLLPQLYTFFEAFPTDTENSNSTFQTIAETKEQLESYVESARLANEDIDTAHPRDPRVVESAQSLSRILHKFFDTHMQPLDTESTTLWDIWYMGSAPFPVNFMDPVPRASIVAALLRPHIYIPPTALGISDELKVISNDAKRSQLWQLPDTSILFWRYLEGGRMVNVYDWYESFKQVIDVQREMSAVGELSAERRAHKPAESASAEEDDEEKAGLETQARFMRALHELDFLGFVKHTGRKADHIVRTTFDQE